MSISYETIICEIYYMSFQFKIGSAHLLHAIIVILLCGLMIPRPFFNERSLRGLLRSWIMGVHPTCLHFLVTKLVLIIDYDLQS